MCSEKSAFQEGKDNIYQEQLKNKASELKMYSLIKESFFSKKVLSSAFMGGFVCLFVFEVIQIFLCKDFNTSVTESG